MSWADCAACGERFSSDSAFDRHQSWEGGQLVCHPPAERGLVVNSRGRWAWPGSAPSGLRGGKMRAGGREGQ